MKLHKDPAVVAPEILLLLRQLQAITGLKNFYLGGGTALALQMGHRSSSHIDLITRDSFVNQDLIGLITTSFSIQVTEEYQDLMVAFIHEIITRFIRHDYPFVNPPMTEDGITFLSKPDIAAMKLLAISNSGQRVKDFMDIYFLLEHYSISDMLGFFSIKYPNYNTIIPVRAISYFGDLDQAMDPPLPVKPVSVKELKARITDAVLHSKKTY